MKLLVIQGFGAYSVGDQITSQSEVQAILESEQSAYVVQAQDDPVDPPKKSQVSE